MENEENANLFVAALWMVGVSLLLFFIPLLNGLIGGAIGGYKAGSPSRGVMAALIPALLVSVGLWAIFAVFGGPVLGFFAGVAAGLLVLLADVGLFIGAWIGGYFARNRGTRPMVPA